MTSEPRPHEGGRPVSGVAPFADTDDVGEVADPLPASSVDAEEQITDVVLLWSLIHDLRRECAHWRSKYQARRSNVITGAVSGGNPPTPRRQP